VYKSGQGRGQKSHNFSGRPLWMARNITSSMDFQLAVVVYRQQHGLVPYNLSHDIHCVTSSSSQLMIQHAQLSIISRCAFPLANSTPCNSTSALTFAFFRNGFFPFITLFSYSAVYTSCSSYYIRHFKQFRFNAMLFAM